MSLFRFKRDLGYLLVLFLIPSFFLSSCCFRPFLTCRSEYLYPSYLASVQVNTPDPDGVCFYGQQIIISWNFPQKCLEKPLNLTLSIRYGDRELETISIPMKNKRGNWIYRLINQEYWCKEGILSFQARIQSADGEIYEEWSHSLWAPLIQISSEI